MEKMCYTFRAAQKKEQHINLVSHLVSQFLKKNNDGEKKESKRGDDIFVFNRSAERIRERVWKANSQIP